MGYQITRPDTDQIKFTSSKTGNHILEEYLEDAEKGTKTLGELLDLLFNEDGSVRNFVAVDGLVEVENGGTGSSTIDGALSNLGFGQFGKTLATSEDANGARFSLGLVPGTTAGSMVQLDAQAKLPAVDGSQLTGIPGLVNIVRISAAGSGTYNKPSNVTKIVLRVKGAGGGGSGGYGDYGGGGGGGGGAYAEKLISSPAASYAYSIGAGGVGTPYGGGAASAGGNTTIGGITCNGGLGGHEVNPGTVGAGGLGGTASGGDLNVPGDGGGSGGIKGGVNGSSSGGVGGGGYLGGAGRAGSSGVAAGSGSHGGGGGGGGHGNTGGNGGAGYIEIEEYA